MVGNDKPIGLHLLRDGHFKPLHELIDEIIDQAYDYYAGDTINVSDHLKIGKSTLFRKHHWGSRHKAIGIPRADRRKTKPAITGRKMTRGMGNLPVGTELHFVDPSVSIADAKLFLGPFEESDGPTFHIGEGWSMAHILYHAGSFPSVSQAKKNGWDKPIPRGYEELTVGKKRLRIYILTPFD